MVKKILLAIIFFVFVKSISAVENNKFGIHLAQPHLQDLKAAAELVNSSGGDWGYVTLVIQENDRDRRKWQEIFDQLRELHLIPIIRLATTPVGPSWQRPSKDGAKEWVEFLDSLNWVVKNRYVILFNEPNHGSEWGGAVDPQDYARVAFAFAKALKEKNPDFFVMLAGLDASAPSSPPQFEDEEIFLNRLLGEAEKILSQLNFSSDKSSSSNIQSRKIFPTSPEEIFLRKILTGAGDLTKNNNPQKDSNHCQSKGDLDIGADIPDIKIFHNPFFSKRKLATKKNIHQNKSPVNIQKALGSVSVPKLGVIKRAENQTADRLIEKLAAVLNNALFDFFEEKNFIKIILAKESPPVKKGLFDYIDGWVSHSYPNPAFSGSPWDVGRGSVRTYQWELELLKSLGVNKELPVFITETGWRRDIRYSILDISNDKIAQNLKIAFEQVWLPDERVMAVTPFVLDYQMEPFLGFSWKKHQSDEFYPQYYAVQSLPKVKGEPEKIEKGEINFDLPKELVEQSTYQFKIRLKNFGQAIWEKDNGYSLSVISYSGKERLFDFLFSDLKNIQPFEEREVELFLKTTQCLSCQGGSKNINVEFVLKKEEKEILKSNRWQFKIIHLPSLKFKVNLFPKLNEKGDDFEIQIFDERENLVFKKSGFKVEHGVGDLKGIQNIIPGKKYRLVVLKPYYLPRQNFLVFKKGENTIKFKPLIPLDFNKDGQFSLGDFRTLIKNPQLLKLIFP